MGGGGGGGGGGGVHRKIGSEGSNFRNPCEKCCEFALQNFARAVKFRNPCKKSYEFSSELLDLPTSKN